MLLTIGTLALYRSLGSSNVLAEQASRQSTATNLAASDLERVRSVPYADLAIKIATAGPTYFEGDELVTDATNGRLLPMSSVIEGGVTYEVARHVTWRSAVVNGSTVAQAFKQVTVVVAWTDERGTHDVRSATAISRTSAP